MIVLWIENGDVVSCVGGDLFSGTRITVKRWLTYSDKDVNVPYYLDHGATFPLTKLSAFHAAITFPVLYSPGDPSICGGGGRGTRICTESQGVVRFDAPQV